MQFKILTGLDFDTDFLTKVMDLDSRTYETEYVGVLENMVARYEKNRDSFVCIWDEERGKLAGYINFFPCTKALYEDIRYYSPVIRDDDISPDEIAPYSKEGNHLFILSIVIDEEYRGTKGAITALSDAWINHLNGLVKQDYPITDICAIAVSDDGKKALRNYMFVVERKLTDGNIVYVCENRPLDEDDPESKSHFLDKLLAHKLYFKSYRSDIYLMLPLADNVNNHRLDKFFDKSKSEDPGDSDEGEEDAPAADKKGNKNTPAGDRKGEDNVSAADSKSGEDALAADGKGEDDASAADSEEDDAPAADSEGKEGEPTAEDIVRTLMDGLNDCIAYEVSNNVVEELDMIYLGEFELLHTTDDYPPEGKEIVVGEEKMYAILTAHRPSHMYVLTLFLHDSPYSTTQVQDQLSYGYLKIRCPKDAKARSAKGEVKPKYIDIYEYIKHEYGLLKCGDGKTLLCMSGKPDDPREFQNILSGEVYNSMHIDYHIQSEEIDEMCHTNHAQYDYYEVYLSDVVIAFILKEFSEDVCERIELTATYAFIAQLVMFQNTSIAKTNIKITNALANSGDISYEQIHELYSEFGKTVRFWEIRNFKYNGTQAEASCITKAFSNEELKQTYYEHQEFLEHIVELKTAQTEAVNGTVLNIVATVLAVIQIQDFAVGLLTGFYNYLGIEVIYAQKTFTTVVISLTLTILIIYMILRKKKRNMYKHNMMNGQKRIS